MKLLFWNSSGLTDGINKVTVIHKVSFVHVDGELKKGSEGQGRHAFPQKTARTAAYRLIRRNLLEDGVFGAHGGGQQDLQP